MTIIDCHCHAGHGDGMTAPWNTVAPLDQHLRRARAAGIRKTVVFAPFHSDYSAANEEVARIVAQRPEELVGFAFVHPKRDAGRIGAMVGRAVVRHGFRGIKVHGKDALPTRELCETAHRFRVPILVDVVGRAHVIDMLAPQFPGVNFIIPHLGSFGDDFRAHQAVIDQLVRYPNVYADSSGVRRFDYLVEAVARAGARKILFGSDGPWLHPGLELHKIRLLGLPRHEEALILGGNAARLLSDGAPFSSTPRPPRRPRGPEVVAGGDELYPDGPFRRPTATRSSPTRGGRPRRGTRGFRVTGDGETLPPGAGF